MKTFIFLLLLPALCLSACGTSMSRVALNPSGHIEFVEHRTFMSTTPVAVIFDNEDRIIGVASGTGLPIMGAVLGGVQATSIVGAGMLIKQGLSQGMRTSVNVTAPGAP